MQKVYRHFFQIACLLFIAIGICLHFVMFHHPFEYDEIFTAVTANPAVPLGWIIRHYLLPDVHPPLHNIFLWLYNHLVPYGPEWILRLPSTVSSLLALAVGWFLFPKCYGKLSRYIFISLCTTNFFVLFYAQQARPYAFLFLEGMVLLLVIVRMFHHINHKHPIPTWQWVIYFIALLSMMYTQCLGAVVAVVTAGILFMTCCLYRQFSWKAIVLPGISLLLFLPWLIPNFLANRQLARFSGTWWGNSINTDSVIPIMDSLFVNKEWIYYAFAVLWIGGIVYSYLLYRKKRAFMYGKDLLFFGSIICTVLAAATVLLIVCNMYFFIARYFMGMLPMIYLFFTLCILPLLHKHWISKLVFLILVGWLIFPNFKVLKECKHHYGFLAKVTSEMFRKNTPNKNLYVITAVPFPAEAMDEMYGFYLNKRFGMHVNVTELNHRNIMERQILLNDRHNATIWVPDCQPQRLAKLAKDYNRQIGIEGLIYGAGCIIQMADEGAVKKPAFEFIHQPRPPEPALQQKSH